MVFNFLKFVDKYSFRGVNINILSLFGGRYVKNV